jgi:hypothetical protein
VWVILHICQGLLDPSLYDRLHPSHVEQGRGGQYLIELVLNKINLVHWNVLEQEIDHAVRRFNQRVLNPEKEKEIDLVIYWDKLFAFGRQLSRRPMAMESLFDPLPPLQTLLKSVTKRSPNMTHLLTNDT